MKKFLLVLLLVVIGVGERVLFDLGPNVELVTTVVMLVAAYWGRREAVGVAAAVMVLSDLILGNTNIFLFTWSAFLLEAMVASEVFGRFKRKGLAKVALGTGVGLGSSLFFFWWTNLGVWWLDSWGMYSRDLRGLVTCYVKALPFLKVNIVGTLIFVPLGFGIAEMKNLRLKIRNYLGNFSLNG
jgi:hypothetical protein